MEKAGTREDIRRLVDDRWDTLTIGVHATDASPTNSDLIDAWMQRTRAILGRMIHGAESDAEYTLLGNAEERVFEALDREARALALEVELQRAAAEAAA